MQARRATDTIGERASRILEAMRQGSVLSSERYYFGEQEHNEWARLDGKSLDPADPSGGMDAVHELQHAELVAESDQRPDPTNANHETVFYILTE